MRDRAPRGPSLAFLVAAWLLFLVLGLGYVALSVWDWDGQWHVLHAFIGLGVLWAVITGLIVRRLWPKSPLARLLPERFHGRRCDEPAHRPLLTILLVLAGAIALVAASLHFGWH